MDNIIVLELPSISSQNVDIGLPLCRTLKDGGLVIDDAELMMENSPLGVMVLATEDASLLVISLCRRGRIQ